MPDPSKADRKQKKKISDDAPKRDPEHGRQEEEAAKNSDAEKGEAKLARDRQPPPREDSGKGNAGDQESGDRSKEDSA